MLHSYFKTLYKRTMEESYTLVFKEIANALIDGGHCLDCGASEGGSFDRLNEYIKLDKSRYNVMVDIALTAGQMKEVHSTDSMSISNWISHDTMALNGMPNQLTERSLRD